MRPDMSFKSLFFLVFSRLFKFLAKISNYMRPGISLKSLGGRESGREAGTRELKPFRVLFGNL